MRARFPSRHILRYHAARYIDFRRGDIIGRYCWRDFTSQARALTGARAGARAPAAFSRKRAAFLAFTSPSGEALLSNTAYFVPSRP